MLPAHLYDAAAARIIASHEGLRLGSWKMPPTPRVQSPATSALIWFVFCCSYRRRSNARCPLHCLSYIVRSPLKKSAAEQDDSSEDLLACYSMPCRSVHVESWIEDEERIEFREQRVLIR